MVVRIHAQRLFLEFHRFPEPVMPRGDPPRRAVNLRTDRIEAQRLLLRPAHGLQIVHQKIRGRLERAKTEFNRIDLPRLPDDFQRLLRLAQVETFFNFKALARG